MVRQFSTPMTNRLHVIASIAEERVAMTAPRERQALAAAAAAEGGIG